LTVRSRAFAFPLVLASVLGASCLHQEGPEDPSPIETPSLVSVRVEYRQPNGCLNTVTPCDGSVRFFASWMNPEGAHVALTPVPGSDFWTGTVHNVPVNFPPAEQAYLVRIYDPYLLDQQTAGVTADRLKVGGQAITKFFEYGTPSESGLVYIDAQGVGHNPF
jgi:hypothetical protein